MILEQIGCFFSWPDFQHPLDGATCSVDDLLREFHGGRQVLQRKIDILQGDFLHVRAERLGLQTEEFLVRILLLETMNQSAFRRHYE